MDNVVLPEDLKKVELLSTLPEGALQELAVLSTIRHFAPGEFIFKEGDLGESLHVLLEGVVKIISPGPDGQDVTLATLTPGQYFGELAVLDPAPRSATVKSIDDTTTVEVAKQDLERVLDRDPGASRRMLGTIARKLTEEREKLKRTNLSLDDQVREQTREIRETQLEVIRRLGQAAEFRDDDTGMHISRMSQLAAMLGRATGMSEKHCELLLHAAPMHDIGKIGIPDRILLKPGRLEPEEFDIMKTHTTIGEALLKNSASQVMQLAQVIALCHHEKWDGGGYPRGIKGEEIPLEARLCTISDVFDALTSERPYKKAWTIDDALAEIEKCGGTHFDPELAKTFVSMKVQILETLKQWTETAEQKATKEAHERAAAN